MGVAVEEQQNPAEVRKNQAEGKDAEEEEAEVDTNPAGQVVILFPSSPSMYSFPLLA